MPLLDTRRKVASYLGARRCGCVGQAAALATAAELDTVGIGAIVDHSVEDAPDLEDNRALKRRLVADVGDVPVPVKPTAVADAGMLARLTGAIRAAPDPDAARQDPEALAALGDEDRAAHAEAVAFLCSFEGGTVLLDAEHTHLQPAVDHLFLAALRNGARNLYNTYQCYLEGSGERLALDAALARELGAPFGAKLVRGAYLGEARAAGFLRASKEDTDAAYDAAVAACLEAAAAGEDRSVLICTHNPDSCALAVSRLDALGLARSDPRVAFAQILGLGDCLTHALAGASINVRKLVLFGKYSELAPWLARRLEENADALGAPAAEGPLLWGELWRRVVGSSF